MYLIRFTMTDLVDDNETYQSYASSSTVSKSLEKHQPKTKRPMNQQETVYPDSVSIDLLLKAGQLSQNKQKE